MEEKLDGAVTSGKFLFTSPVQEQHIDFLLEEEFACNPKFLDFFLKASKFSDRQQVGDFPVSCDESECKVIRSVTTEDGETDVLVVFRAKEDQRWVALLIEDKIRAGFQKEQAKRYRDRGNEGIHAGHWARYFTCLVSPAKYALPNRDFDTRVTLEEVAGFFSGEDRRSSFKRKVLERALQNFATSGVKIKDEKVTLFREFYAKQAATFFSPEEVMWEPPRDAWWGDTWFIFRRGALLRGVSIFHKAQMGVVDLSFAHTDQTVLRSVIDELDGSSEHDIQKTGKSASIRLKVSKISNFSEAEKVLLEIREAFSAVRKLLIFYQQHASKIEAGLDQADR